MARPRELANILGQLDEIVPGLSAERATTILASVSAVAPAIRAVLDFVADIADGRESAADLDVKLAARIEQASARNRSADVQAELQAELAALTGPDTERPR